jgi:beta-lactam-binding protein with PASTA domain
LLAGGLLAILVAFGVWFAPQLNRILNPPPIASPTPTPIIPTATPTPTTPPPTLTPTSTPTVTPTATATPISVRVPKLTELQLADAKKLAEQEGFVLQEIERRESPEWPVGVVFQQDPPPNTLLKKTSVIQVRVSSGPPPFKLPPLTNTDPETARLTLESTGLKVELAYEGSLNLPKGVVTRTEPPADSSVRPGDTIKVFISMGETARVPDLKGMRQTPEEPVAENALNAAGLTLGAVTEVGREEVGDAIDSVPPGNVFSQEPAPGTELEKGAAVNIRVRRQE